MGFLNDLYIKAYDSSLKKLLRGVFASKVEVSKKQDTLVSGTNIKTVGGTSILGSGNIPFPTQRQADWNQTSSSSVDYIKNKPLIPIELTYGDTSIVWNDIASTFLAGQEYYIIYDNMRFELAYCVNTFLFISVTKGGISIIAYKPSTQQWDGPTARIFELMGYKIDDLANSQTPNVEYPTLALMLEKLNELVGRMGYSDFSTSVNYAVGDIVYRSSQLCRFTTAHPAGAWIGSDTEAVSIKSLIEEASGEMVNITATADQGSVSSATITVKVDGDVYATGTGALSVRVFYGKTYTVEVSRVYDYITPQSVTYTAAQAVRNISMAYTYIQRDTIAIDQTETDDTAMITGDVQGTVIQAIRAASHAYLGKAQQDGSELICQLSDTDGTKYYDGTTAALNGTEGDQWMKLPVFWYKVAGVGTPDANGACDEYNISFAIAGEPDPTWKKWEGDKNLIGAKEMTVINGVGHTVSGGQSTGNFTQANGNMYAAARGTGNITVTWEWQWMMCTLFYAWYGRTNSQAQCGTGSSSYTRTLGTKDSLGMTDTTASNGNSDNTKFWGLENWWNCKNELVGNVTSQDYVLTVKDMNTGQNKTLNGFIQCGGTGGWSSRFKITEDLDYIPVAKAGTETTSYCDWVNSNSGSRVVHRSFSYANAGGGVACVSSNSDPSYTNANVGSRLAFNGVITEAESVADFKAA